MKKTTRFLPVLLALILSLSACGKAVGSVQEITTDTAAHYDMNAATAEDAGWAEPMMAESEAAFPAEEPAPAADAGPAAGGETYDETTNYASDLKIIRTGDLSLETETFDQTDAFIRKTVAEYQGLLTESSVSGTVGYRYAGYTVRIPSDDFEKFFYQISGDCTVIHQTISAEDVTEQYTDLSTRLETAKKKYARLLELLDTVQTLTDVYALESEISNTEYEIDYLTGTINGLDSRITYSTVYISVSETSRQSAMPENRGFLASLSAALTNGTNHLTESFQDLLISMAYHWLFYLVCLLALIAALVIFFRIRRKRKQKKLSAEPAGTPPSDSE